jgi:predicted 3-demethylubiquinone-9 3-methyltransferase (glyoxalase superfamily)
MQRITPFLWFDNNAEEAMRFYVSVFAQSEIVQIERYPDESLDEHFTGMRGKVISGTFALNGHRFMCLDGGPQFHFNPSISLFCTFQEQAAIKAVWEQLIDGGKTLMEFQAYPWAKLYGWLQDRYGVTWQLSLSDHRQTPQFITPHLLFTNEHAGKAQAAMRFYTSLFENSGIDALSEYAAGDEDPAGFVKLARFHLGDDHFQAADSSAPHQFTFNEAISLFVSCKDQAEIDRLWDAFTADGGQESQCGWCKDRFGVSWQVIPESMNQLLSASPAAIQAMMQMQKIDIATLEQAGKDDR